VAAATHQQSRPVASLQEIRPAEVALAWLLSICHILLRRCHFVVYDGFNGASVTEFIICCVDHYIVTSCIQLLKSTHVLDMILVMACDNLLLQVCSSVMFNIPA